MFTARPRASFGTPRQRLQERARAAASGQAATRPTVVCGWCETVLEHGDGRISHGICDCCMPKLLATVMQRETALTGAH